VTGWGQAYGKDFSETLGFELQTPGNYPEESIYESEYGEN
jgi:hypothetical protein